MGYVPYNTILFPGTKRLGMLLVPVVIISLIIAISHKENLTLIPSATLT